MEDRYDENYNAAGCEDQGIPSEYCRVKKDVVTDLHMSYTGIKNTTIALNLYNVFDRAAPADVRLSNPPLRGRSARVSLQYVF
jgi:iron complex outermembrane receptor protein